MRKVDLTEGKVIKVLTALSMPIMISSLLQFTYNLVDMLWVGALGSDSVASVGSSSFFIGLGYSINALVVIGTSIKVAHAIGERKEKVVKSYINSGLIVNGIIAVIYAFILICAGKYFINFLNLNNNIVERQSYYYLAIHGPILFFGFYNMLYSKIVGSFGNNKVALKISAIGIIANIILDPIFIYVFDLGVIGAAIATLLSNIIMFIIYQNKSMLFLRYDKKIPIDFNKIKEICILGIPMSFQRVLFTLINILLARIIGSFGADAIAAQKIGLQIESITYMVIGGLHGAIASFIGQNYGAKKFDRVFKGYETAIKIGIIYSIFMAIIFMFFNIPIIRLFVRENETIKIASNYLKIVAFSQIFSTIETVSNGTFTGLGLPKIPSIISIVFTALRVPMALVLIKYYGVNGVWISISISSILKGLTAYLMYILKVKNQYKNMS